MAGPRPLIRPAGRASHPAFFALVVLLAFVAAVAPARAVAPDGSPVEVAKISQAGKKLIFQIRTDRQVALKKLERMPNLERARASYLCFEMTRRGSKIISRICMGGKKNSHHRIGITRANRVNEIYSKDTVAASVRRVAERKLVFSIDPEISRLKPAGYTWRVVYSDGSCRPGRFNCRSSFPVDRRKSYRVRPVQIVGCTGGDGQFITHGPRGRKRIALTFDDGPSAYTGEVLSILKRYGVKSTFFQIGQEVERYPEESRRILAQGHELANHTTHHGFYPGYSDLKTTNSIIERATGFRPCLMRPPGGGVSSSVLGAAAEAKMKVVNWDIDTSDWRLPGSGSILGQIRNARSGSIVLMHDGGGPRSQTIDALAAGIESLQGRGYKLVTVTELLGNEFIYRPK